MGKKEIFCYSLRLKNPDAINILNYLRNHNSDLSVNAIISRALIAIGPNGLDVVGNNRMTIEKEDKIRSSKANTEICIKRTAVSK